MNGRCESCDVADRCAYPYKPTDCCNYRKFQPMQEYIDSKKGDTVIVLSEHTKKEILKGCDLVASGRILFDTIKISQQDRTVTIAYAYQGHDLFYQTTEVCLAAGDTITLTDHHGSIGFRLDAI